MTALLATPELLSDDDVLVTPRPVPLRHAWYPTSPCGEHCRATDPDAAVGRLMVALRLIRLAVTVLMLVVVGAMVSMTPRIVRRRYLRMASRGLLSAIGVRIDVDDRRPYASSTRGLVVANHISYLDILALAVVSPAHFVAKSDVAHMSVISGLARRFGVITIERDSLRTLPTVVADAVARLHRDSSVAVFPEGTTWCGAEQGRFRPAFFQAAIDAGVPVIPVRLGFHTPAGTSTAASFIGDDTPADTLRRVLRTRGLTMHVRVHELQLPTADRRVLAARCERLLAPSYPFAS
ncbi:lysophospholipid acyltransferase family protein [Gordonia sp. CPCC 205515]|uniref:lysophospholipid acyltransferase family protein n=1 Tax=Gordonia sp. CPCC 205515 TaxID=3140791 RepID=UPI003AF3C265